MATLLILAKIGGIILALRFFQMISTAQTEPSFLSLQIIRFKDSLKLFFGAILILGLVSLMPIGQVLSNFNPLSNTIKQAETTINKEDILGTWEIENETYTISYDQDREIHFDYGQTSKKGAWNITGDILRITTNEKTREYKILTLTESVYEIQDVETQVIFKGLKIDEY